MGNNDNPEFSSGNYSIVKAIGKLLMKNGC